MGGLHHGLRNLKDNHRIIKEFLCNRISLFSELCLRKYNYSVRYVRTFEVDWLLILFSTSFHICTIHKENTGKKLFKVKLTSGQHQGIYIRGRTELQAVALIQTIQWY